MKQITLWTTSGLHPSFATQALARGFLIDLSSIRGENKVLEMLLQGYFG